MAAIGLNRLYNSFKTFTPHSNIDYWYGPYDSEQDAKDFTLEENVVDVGLTVGIYTDSTKSKVKEKWFQKDESGEWELVDKIEQYELVLNEFSLSFSEDPEHLNRLIIAYNIGGKGLLPKVTISGTDVQSKSVNFGSRETTYIDLNTPGKYSYKISVTDAIGSKFNNNGINVVQEISFGDIIAKYTNIQQILNVLPQQSQYEGKAIGIQINYNTDVIRNVKVFLNDYEFNDIIERSPGNINTLITLPTGNYYTTHNQIKVVYEATDPDIDEEPKVIYDFDILLNGEFALSFPNEIPSIGYSGTSISFNINVKYGGGDETSKQVRITLNNENEYYLNTSLNTTRNVLYPIGNINLDKTDTEGKRYADCILKIEIPGKGIVETKDIQIYEVTTPKQPCGIIYFNKDYGIVPHKTDNSNRFQILPNTINTELVHSSETEVKVISNLNDSFNLDFNIRTSQNGQNDPLIIIKRGNYNLLTVGKQYITSDLFENEGKTFQTNNLVLPQDGNYVHIGFGYQREFTYSNKHVYYSCIFINGEIAFCTESNNKYVQTLPDVYFNNNFNLSEFSYDGITISDDASLESSVDSNGDKKKDYVLGSGNYDVFYYNWLTTLSPEEQPKNNEDLIELQLVPFTNTGEQTVWWSKLMNEDKGIAKLGSPIEKLKNFVHFGSINYGKKNGIGPTRPYLFEFTKDDKEEDKLDKVYGVICKYCFTKNTTEIISFNDNKFCIVQVQGTSTLAYPVPNFQFTFIKYDEDNDKFELDNSIELDYVTPVFSQENLTFTTKTITGETNLVAKADSMDSSHLNNTPTCIYLNSLINKLNEDNSNNFKFDNNYLDAIVGFPILLKIDSRDGNDVDYDVLNKSNSSINYNSYGTFMLNSGKSANNMGLNDKENPIFSLEGQSNETKEEAGSPGIFTLPVEEKIDEKIKEEEIREIYHNAIGAFNKVSLSFENQKVEIVDDGTLDDTDKINIMKYLINDEAFESRSCIKDKDLLNVNNWDKYGKHVLRMWLFVNRTSQSDFETYFSQVFDLNYAMLYYIHLLLFGQADNLGKNMMIDCKWNNDYTKEKWYIRSYDLDSQLGLTNNGFDDFPVYGCISKQHFDERYGRTYSGSLPQNTFNKYNSASSNLWIKFWAAFKEQIQSMYDTLRRNYITSDRIISIGQNIISNFISKEQYNIDFSLKHLGTEYSYLNKGGRFLNYKDWITKRFMYVDSYFSYFTARYDQTGYDGYTWTIDKTLIPIFYEADYQKPTTRYGYQKYTHSTILDSNMQYVLQIVPEAVLNMSPIWGSMIPDVENGLYKNLQTYQGPYRSVFFDGKTFKNLVEINITEAQGTISEKSMSVPDSVGILTLNNLTITGQLLFETNSSIEEIHIYGCNLSGLSLQNLSLLKKVTIENSTLTSLTLSNLKLNSLIIDSNSRIVDSLTIEGQITLNNVIDLSGINCGNIIFTNSTVEELYLNQLYNLNGTICSIYDFGENKKVQIVSLVPVHEEKKASNIQINGEYIYLNDTNFERIASAVQTLDLSSCTNLKLFSCIGSNLTDLTLPTSVKTLNLQFCKNLVNINSNDGFDFSGFSGLKCTPYTLMQKSHYSDSIGHPFYSFYEAFYNELESFNFAGCDSVRKIKNLKNLNSNFTGQQFVSGCRNLGFRNNSENEYNVFEGCNITFTNLDHSFNMTENLKGIPSNLIFNLNSSSILTCAFQDSGLSVENILNKPANTSNQSLKSLELESTGYAFVGISLQNGLGSELEPLELKWKNCSGLFETPIYTNFNGYGYETLTHLNAAYGKTISSSGDPGEIYIKLPKASYVSRMFYGQNIKIMNEDVFNKNSDLIGAFSFLGGSKQERLIDFSQCTNLSDVGHCYYNTKLDPRLTSGATETMSGGIINFKDCKLPKNTSGRINAQSMFRGVDLTNFDIKSIFNNVNVRRINCCFMNTNCHCSGSPFSSEIQYDNIDISGMFATTVSSYTTDIGIISDLSWITENMTTSAYGQRLGAYTTGEIAGVFEGRQIYNFRELPSPASSYLTGHTGQERMFRNATINSYIDNTFIIDAYDSSRIFEGTTFNLNNRRLDITLTENVVILNNAFRNSNDALINIDINDDSNIVDMDYCFYQCRGNVLINKKEEDHIYLKQLQTAKYAFSDATAISSDTFPTPSSSEGTTENEDNINLFKGCTNLKYIDKIFQYGPNLKVNLSDCISLITMNYAFCGSSMDSLPKLPQTLSNLTNMKGAFRRMGLDYQKGASFTLTANALENAEELFAESKITANLPSNISDESLHFKVYIQGNRLSKINASSTNDYFDIEVGGLANQISASQPTTIFNITTQKNTTTYTGGILSIEKLSAENTRFLLINDADQTSSKWLSVDTRRQILAPLSIYVLSTLDKKSDDIQANSTNSLNLGNLSTMGGLENPDSIDLYNPELEME